MKLSLFFLKMRVRAYFSTDNWKIILLNTIFLLLGLFYSFVVLVLLDRSVDEKFLFTKAKIISSVNIAVFLLPLMLKVFPSFAYKKPVLGNYYPISKIRIAALDLVIFNFLRPVVLMLYVCITALYMGSRSFDAVSALNALLFVSTGFLFAENLVTAISWNRAMVLPAGIVVLPVVVVNFLNPGMLLLSLLVLTVVAQLFIQFRLYAGQPSQDADSSVTSSGTERPEKEGKYLFQKISLRKPAFRTTIIIAFIIKFLLLFIYLPTAKESFFTYISNPAFFLGFAPNFLFSYIFNNAWGYFRAFTFNMVMAGGGIREFMKAYLRLLVGYVLADFLVAITAILVFGVFSFRLIMAYFLCTFFSFSVGLAGSFFKFFEIKKAMSLSSFKPNTSPLINIFTIIPTVLFIFLYKDTVAVGIITLSILLAGTLILIWLHRNEQRILVKFRSKVISGLS